MTTVTCEDGSKYTAGIWQSPYTCRCFSWLSTGHSHTFNLGEPYYDDPCLWFRAEANKDLKCLLVPEEFLE